MEILLLVVILGILTWNLKQGFDMIDERLRDIHKAIQENSENNNNNNG